MNEKVPTTEASLPAPAPTPRSARSTRPTFGARAFRALVLLSAAATLFTLLPGSRLDVRQSFISTPLPLRTAAADPADTWRDDVWPLRDPTPWDISTDFPFARKLEYDVSEGTWLRLDVHPRTGDVVFDMLGDLYCLPADAYSASALTVGASPTRARPILVGVPHDSDPRFSPDGSKLVFRSDAELGIENIWVAEWKGCEAMDVRPRDEKDTELASALSVKEAEEDMLARGVKEDAARKRFRLLREGRLGGMYCKHRTCALPLIFECSSPRHQRDVPMGLRRPLPPFRLQAHRDKVVHLLAQPWRRRRVGVRHPIPGRRCSGNLR